MKYYYQNQLIRTSDNDYKYALIVKPDGDGKIYVKKCSSTHKGCETELNRITKLFRNCQAKGIDYGKALKYWNDSVMASIKKEPFQRDRNMDAVVKGIWSDQLADPRNYQIVELEAR